MCELNISKLLTVEFNDYVNLCAEACGISTDDAFKGMYFGIGRIASSIDPSISTKFIMDAYMFTESFEPEKFKLDTISDPERYVRLCSEFLRDSLPLITSHLINIKEYHLCAQKVSNIFGTFFNPYINPNVGPIGSSEASKNWVITKDMQISLSKVSKETLDLHNDLSNLLIAVFFSAVTPKKRFTKPVLLREAIAKLLDIYGFDKSVAWTDLAQAYKPVSEWLCSPVMYQKYFKFLGSISLYVGFNLKQG